MKYILTAIFGLVATAALAAPTPITFVMVPAESSIRFEVMQGTGPVKGGFEKFGADISFHPDALEQSKATVVIETGSMFLSDAEAQATAVNNEWVDITSYPTATFTTDTFNIMGAGSYQAMGSLTMKGVTIPVTLSFTLDQFSEKEAKITGTATVKRRDLKIGWEDTKSVADEVKIFVNLKAVAK